MLRELVLTGLLGLTAVATACGEDEPSGSAPPDAGWVADAAPEGASAEADAADAAAERGDAEADAGDAAAEGGDAAVDSPFDGASDAGKLGVMSVATLAALLPTKTFLLINVHVPYAGEIPGTARNISYQDVAGLKAFIGPNKATDVVVYCYSNTMAIMAGNTLVADGYGNVRYVDGGLSAWKSAGYPVEYKDNRGSAGAPSRTVRAGAGVESRGHGRRANAVRAGRGPGSRRVARQDPPAPAPRPRRGCPGAAAAPAQDGGSDRPAARDVQRDLRVRRAVERRRRAARTPSARAPPSA